MYICIDTYLTWIIFLNPLNNTFSRFYCPCPYFPKEKMRFRVLNHLSDSTPHTSARVGIQTPTQLAPEWVSYTTLCCRLPSPSPGHLSVSMHAQTLSHDQLFANSWTVACQALWDSPGKNTGLRCHGLLLGIFPTRGLNPYLLCLLHGQKQEGREWPCLTSARKLPAGWF